MSTGQFEIYAPLQDFQWSGNQFELAPGLWIKRLGQRPDLRGLYETLGQDEQQNISSADSWLAFEWVGGTEPSAQEITGLVLLALWMVKPNGTHIAWRFHLGHDEASPSEARSRYLDRFARWDDTLDNEFSDADLRLAASFYSVLHNVHITHSRLNDAMILTLTGRWSHRWQAAMICLAAAAETLLTYSTKHGLTRRLATSYACLVESSPTLRDKAHQEFCSLYSVRSDIVHGRANNIPVSDRRAFLARLEEVLRRTWRTIVSSQTLITALEGTDAQREAYFQSISSGYSPPP